MNSVPQGGSPMQGRTVVTLRMTPGWLLAAVLGLVLVGAALALWSHWSRWSAYLAAEAAEELAASEAAVRDQAVAGQRAAQDVAAAKAAIELDKRLHPEKYRPVEWRGVRELSEREQGMAFGGARGQQGLARAYSGTLWADLTWGDSDMTYEFGINPLRLTSASAGNMGSIIATCDTTSVMFGISSEGEPGGYSREVTEEEEAAIARWVSDWWSAGIGHEMGLCYVWHIRTWNGADPTGDVVCVASGWSATSPVMRVPGVWRGPDEMTVTWAIEADGGYRRAKVTEDPASGFSDLTDVRQRTGAGIWAAGTETEYDTQAAVTTVHRTLNVSTVGNPSSEQEFTTVSLALALEYNHAPDTNTTYGSISVNLGADEEPLDLSTLSMFIDNDNAKWHYHDPDSPPDSADIKWQTVISGAGNNTVGLQRGAAALSTDNKAFGTSATPRSLTVVPRLWKQNASADEAVAGVGYSRYTAADYSASAGHPFDLGLYRADGVTEADVSVAPSWTGYSYQETQWTFADPDEYEDIPADVWRVFSNLAGGLRCHLRADWCEANNEDVVFTNPDDNLDYPRDETDDYGNVTHYDLCNIPQPLTFHCLQGELEDPPWRDDWITWARQELNLDKPDGSNRPSQWTAAGAVSIAGEVWTIPAAGGTVSRTLATRRRNRITRMNAHLWTGSGDQQEVMHEWPLMTRANLAIGTTLDDPKWWDPLEPPWPGEAVGVDFEDATDWRMVSCVALSFDTVTQYTAADAIGNYQNVTLRLTYRTLSGQDYYYTSAGWNFGPEDGTFEATWSEQQTADIVGRLYASGPSAGTVKWDLAPDAGDAPLDLELVEKVEVIFGAVAGEQELTFDGWVTTPYDSSDTTTDREHRMRIAHRLKDYWGAGHWIDGMPNYEPTYLYTLDEERVEVGYKRIQDRQHDPDYQGEAQDIRYLKSLSAWVSEQQWAENLLEPTWQTATIEADLEDSDDNVLATAKWGDYDEFGFCLRVGTNADTMFPTVKVYCDCILQGGVRGIAKAHRKRQTDLASTAIELYYSDDNGTTLTLIDTTDTNAQGMYRIGAGREKTPRMYYVRCLATRQWYTFQEFVNAEEHWSAVDATAQEGQALDMMRHPFGSVPWTAWIGNDKLCVAETASGKVTAGTVQVIDTTGDYDACGIETDGGTIYVDARHRDSGAIYRWYNETHGQGTWTGPTLFAEVPA